MGSDPLSVAMEGLPPAERGSLDRRGAATRMKRRLVRCDPIAANEIVCGCGREI